MKTKVNTKVKNKNKKVHKSRRRHPSSNGQNNRGREDQIVELVSMLMQFGWLAMLRTGYLALTVWHWLFGACCLTPTPQHWLPSTGCLALASREQAVRAVAQLKICQNFWLNSVVIESEKTICKPKNRRTPGACRQFWISICLQIYKLKFISPLLPRKPVYSKDSKVNFLRYLLCHLLLYFLCHRFSNATEQELFNDRSVATHSIESFENASNRNQSQHLQSLRVPIVTSRLEIPTWKDSNEPRCRMRRSRRLYTARVPKLGQLNSQPKSHFKNTFD